MIGQILEVIHVWRVHEDAPYIITAITMIKGVGSPWIPRRDYESDFLQTCITLLHVSSHTWRHELLGVFVVTSRVLLETAAHPSIF